MLINEEKITISKKEYDDLIDAQLLLTALENAGVDNWDGYCDAQELYREFKNDNHQ